MAAETLLCTKTDFFHSQISSYDIFVNEFSLIFSIKQNLVLLKTKNTLYELPIVLRTVGVGGSTIFLTHQ